MRLNLPVHGGIDPAQHHEKSVDLALRQTRGEIRLLGFDQYGRAIPDHATLAPTICRTFWPPASASGGGDGNSGNPRVGGPGSSDGYLKPAVVGIPPIGPSGGGIGMWSNVIPVVGGSPVSSHGHDGASTPEGQKALGLGGVGAGAGSAPGVGGVGDPRDWQWVDGVLRHGHWVKGSDGLGGGTWVGDRIGGPSPLNKFGIFPGDAVFRILFPREGGTRPQEIQNPSYRYADVGGGGAGQGASGAAGPAGAAGFKAPGGSYFGGPVLTGGSLRTFNAQPIKSEYQKDAAYASRSVGLPAGWPSIPTGTISAVIAGTHQDRQADHLLHTDPRLVAVNRGIDPTAGSLVCDTNGSGGYDPDHSGPLQSAFRVLAPLKCSFPGGDSPVIAQQYAPSEHDWLAGYGLIADLSSMGGGGGGGATTPITGEPGSGYGLGESKMGSPNDIWQRGSSRERAAAQLSLELTLRGAAGGRGAGATPIGRQVSLLTAALMSQRRGGPIEVGHGAQDKHKCGKSDDGESVNSAHLSTEALFYRDGLMDAPLLFEKLWKGADTYPGSARVHLEYDNNSVHAVNGKTKTGRWRWRAEVPFESDTPYYHDAPPDDPPPSTPKDPPYTREPEDPPPHPPPKPPRVVTDPDAPGDAGGANRAQGGGGLGAAGQYHSGRGMVEGTEKLRGANPFLGLPGGEFYRDPNGLTTILADPTGRGAGAFAAHAEGGDWNRTDPAQLPRFEPRLADPSPLHPTAKVHVRGVGEAVRDTPLSFHQFLQSPGLVFRPQESTPNAPNLAITANPSAAALDWGKRRSPVVAELLAFGGMVGLEPKTTNVAGLSRHPSGDGPGGLLIVPPQYGLAELREDRLPTGVSASETYFGALTGVFFAAGKPNFSTGGMKSGARWGVDSSTGELFVQGLNSSGVATTAIRVKQNGTPGLRESGGTILDLGAVTDGQYLKRSGGTIATDGAPGRLIAVTVYTTGAGNHAPNAAATALIARGVAGGGGGGGADQGVVGGFAAGGGGSSGGWFEHRISGGLAASYAYAVGTGGAGGAAGAAGGAGNDTTFGTATAKGGGGGAGMTGTAAPLVAGGGAATVGGSGSPFSTSGNPGGPGVALAAGAMVGGEGGCSPYGGGGASQATNAVGNAGAGAGSGGGGGATDTGSTRAGGAGTEGLIIVFEYA